MYTKMCEFSEGGVRVGQQLPSYGEGSANEIYLHAGHVTMGLTIAEAERLYDHLGAVLHQISLKTNEEPPK